MNATVNINATVSPGMTPSVYGRVQLGYVLVDSSRLADWKRFAADGIGMAVVEDTASAIALRTDAHARRLIVRKRPNEDVALGWQIEGDDALTTILRRLAGPQSCGRGDRGRGGGAARRRTVLAFHRPEEPGPRALHHAAAGGRAGQGHRWRLRDRRTRSRSRRDHFAQAGRHGQVLAGDLRRQDLRFHRGSHRRHQSQVHLPAGQSAPSLDRGRSDQGARDGSVRDQDPASRNAGGDPGRCRGRPTGAAVRSASRSPWRSASIPTTATSPSTR